MQLTSQLAGQRVTHVLRNGSVLRIVCENGFELDVGWMDTDSGRPVKGEPLVLFAGKRVYVNQAGPPVLHRSEIMP